jgi:hypothetical protein
MNTFSNECESDGLAWSASNVSDRLPIDATLGDLIRRFGADDADLSAVGRLTEAIVGAVNSLLASAMPAFLALAERPESLSQEPETPGHESSSQSCSDRIR